MSDAARRHAGKANGYFAGTRLDLLAMLPAGGGLRLLEIGAGDGATLREAKRRGLAGYTVGVDAVGRTGARAAPDGVDRMLIGDVETMSLELGDDFDAVICADVLEHLVDPWSAVARLAGVLRPGGLFLSSIPNARNHRVLRPLLLRGDFRYAEAGLLDHSHLRFFCRLNVRQLFEQAGLVIEAIEENMGAYGLRHRLVDALTLGMLHEFFVFQFRTRARKPPGNAR